MSETIILVIVVCSTLVLISLLITVGVLIYNYQDNKNLGRSYQLLETDITRVETKVELLEAQFDKFQNGSEKNGSK